MLLLPQPIFTQTKSPTPYEAKLTQKKGKALRVSSSTQPVHVDKAQKQSPFPCKLTYSLGYFIFSQDFEYRTVPFSAEDIQNDHALNFNSHNLKTLQFTILGFSNDPSDTHS